MCEHVRYVVESNNFASVSVTVSASCKGTYTGGAPLWKLLMGYLEGLGDTIHICGLVEFTHPPVFDIGSADRWLKIKTPGKNSCPWTLTV